MRFEAGGEESGGQTETGSTRAGAQEEWPLRQTRVCEYQNSQTLMRQRDEPA